ncbi:hypothetical protein DESC_780219 [Desulfosarcina cetonica]|nr:hypothetical protein DESC_780219 [Desulfosarcina cetonica]
MRMVVFTSMPSDITQQNFRFDQQADKHFGHDQKNQGCQDDLELIAFEVATDLGAELGAQGRADQQDQGQDEIHGVVGVGLHDGDIDAGEKDLEKAGTDDHMHGHAQEVDHDRHHDEPAADSHDGRQHTDEDPQDQGHEDGEFNPGFLEAGLPGQVFDQPGIPGFAAGRGRGRFHAANPLEALDEHVGADEAEHDHIGDLDQEIGVAHVP